MPSISTSITLRFSFMVPTPTDVPQQITSPGRSELPRERFSRVLGMLSSLEVKVLYST